MKQLVDQVARLAAQLGVQTLVLAFVDPQTGQPQVKELPNSLTTLKTALLARLNVIGAASDEVEQLRAQVRELQEQLASKDPNSSETEWQQ